MTERVPELGLKDWPVGSGSNLVHTYPYGCSTELTEHFDRTTSGSDEKHSFTREMRNDSQAVRHELEMSLNGAHAHW